jgi:hypothetical protein
MGVYGVPMSAGEHDDKSEHQDRVKGFQDDLKTQDPLWVIRKHITTGTSAVLSEAVYYELRNEVADHFDIHPSAVVLIGSSRLGFSIKPRKRYLPFDASSDIDLAIISQSRFDQFWDLVFEHWRQNRIWARTRRYKQFLRELFQGWLWPRRLPPARYFGHTIEWVEFEDRLGRERFSGLRSVGARLYRTWDRLEAYQAIHVMECRSALLREQSR